LDRCHRYYQGLEDPKVKGVKPPDGKIEEFYDEVANALIAHGTRPHRLALKMEALPILQKFNELEGDDLYPRVKDTEYRLEEDRKDFVLRGVVDVLTTVGVDDHSTYEIWDYKGSKKPLKSSQLLKDYEWQMCVYAALYERRTGVLPKQAVLYFTNELDVLLAPGVPQKRPKAAVHIVEFDAQRIATALAEFDKTARCIIACRGTRKWDPPADVSDLQSTCDACDLRWSCPSHDLGGGKRTYITKIPKLSKPK
jgi:putative RecB family exonuclease